MQKSIKEVIESKDFTLMGIELRKCVLMGDLKHLKLLHEAGADVNYYTKDKIFTTDTTALHIAANASYMEIVKYLLDNGSDAKIIDGLGNRAYHYAKANNDIAIMKLIKEKDDKLFYEEDYCVNKLRKYNLPEETIEFLGSNNRKIDLEKSTFTDYILFCSVQDVRIFEWNDIIFVDLLFRVENYTEIGVISWIPEKESFGCIDLEHNEFGLMKGMSWQDIICDIDNIIDKSLSWEFSNNTNIF
ncbi:MAG: hypothetical protein CVU84_03900 [Firmicutes bacterium HGW-Firmicutes-1]|jgi:hypothetical protein|nr:MAG: hypothetical protein CVU84_03900 [Firmicutes bacterium HGW-Firmicutes-1]